MTTPNMLANETEEYIRELKAEVERLREALERIANWKKGTDPEYFDIRYENGRGAAAEIAREALDNE